MDEWSDRLIELCERLSGGTHAGRIVWVVEEATSFAWSGSSGAVSVRSRDGDGEEPYELAVFTASGQKVETLTSEWAEDDTPAPWNDALARLYRAARREALGVDKILDDLFAELPGAKEQPRASESKRA